MKLENELLENQLLEKFQVEELEKRYEFAWIDEWSVTGTVEGVSVTVKGKIG